MRLLALAILVATVVTLTKMRVSSFEPPRKGKDFTRCIDKRCAPVPGR